VGGEAVGVKASPVDVDRRSQQVRRQRPGESQGSLVGEHDIPQAINDDTWIRVMGIEHALNRVAHKNHRVVVESQLGVPRRIAGGQEEGVAFSQRYFKVLGQEKEHLKAGPGSTGLDKAQVAGRNTDVDCQVELAESATGAPVPDHVTYLRPGHRLALYGPASGGTITSQVIEFLHYLRHFGKEPFPTERRLTVADVTSTIDIHLEAYCEPDPGRRNELLSEVWSESGMLIDPPFDGTGHVAISGMCAAVLEHYPGHRFQRTGDIDTHHAYARYAWDLVAPDGTVAVNGLDLAEFGGDGKLVRVVGFFGDLPRRVAS
jgi:hypothetical protein